VPPATPCQNPVLAPELGQSTEFPRVEEAHRAAKTAPRHPSPLKQGRRPASSKNIKDLFDAMNIDPKKEVEDNLKASCDADEVEQLSKVIGAIEHASNLIEVKKKEEEAFKKMTEELPLLMPGSMLKRNEIGFGFRVRECDTVLYSSKGDVKVVENKGDTSTKIKAIIMKYKDSLAWNYWSSERMGPNNKTLSECVFEYGLGGWQKGNIKCKGVYLSSDRSFNEHHFFVLAMEADGEQIMSARQEANLAVARIFRSALPEDIKKVIHTRELLNVRQGIEKSSWWAM